MTPEFLDNLDIAKKDEPEADPDLRTLLTNWLDYQRRAFRRKLRNLDAEGIARMSIPPVDLSILGLIRHMTQMEHVYLSWGLGGGERVMVYGDDDFEGGSPDTFETDQALYLEEVEKADRAIVVAVVGVGGSGARPSAAGSTDQDGAGVRPAQWPGAHAPLCSSRRSDPLSRPQS